MRMKTYKAAIIGCGNIASKHDEEKKIKKGIFTHAGAYKKVGRVNLVAAADINEKRLKEFGRFWNVEKLYKNHLELLENEALDVLSICTWDNTHHQIIMDALNINSPKVIFAEKPLADTSARELEILEKAKNAGTKIVVNYQRRWDAGHQKVAKMIKNGDIGDIQATTAYYVKGIRHVGCTIINILRFLISEISSVAAIPLASVETFAKEDPSLDAILFFKNGVKAFVQSCDKGRNTYSIFELDILGTKGRVQIVDNGERVVYYKLIPHHIYPGFSELARYKEEKTQMPWAIVNGVKEIVRILDEGLESFTNEGAEAHKDTLVIESILRSRRSNWTKVDVTGDPACR